MEEGETGTGAPPVDDEKYLITIWRKFSPETKLEYFFPSAQVELIILMTNERISIPTVTFHTHRSQKPKCIMR